MNSQSVKLCLLTGLWSLSSCEVVRKFHYVTEKKTWTEAQSYCRNNYDDLASLLNMEDVTSLLENPELQRANSNHAWIGLSDDKENWTWSLNDTGHHKNTHYSNWNNSQPNTSKGTLICTAMNPEGYWLDYGPACYTIKGPSVCYNGELFQWT